MDDLTQLDQQMARVADGDRTLIQPLFRALWPFVHGYCERALGGGADADDAAQEAMAKVFVEVVRYDKTRRAVPWAIAIAVWECRTVRRRRHRARTVPLDAAANSSAPERTPEEAIIVRDLLDAAGIAFDQLSPVDREVLRLTFEQDIEAHTGASGPTLRKRRERAIGRLRETWRRLYGR
jgi:RNA polymerase sigma factor (sigma-70 family)